MIILQCQVSRVTLQEKHRSTAQLVRSGDCHSHNNGRSGKPIF